MTYIINRRHEHNGKTDCLLEFTAKSHPAAIALFSNFIYAMLAEDISGKYRSAHFTRLQNGKWLLLEWAAPTAEDELDELPAWYEGPGIYDESDRLIMAENNNNLTCITLGDYSYSFAQEDAD